MFSCLQINCQPFYLRQLFEFHPFDWLIEIDLQTEGQGTHHKMVSLQPMPGFSPLFPQFAELQYCNDGQNKHYDVKVVDSCPGFCKVPL